ncbi:MAG: nucleotidyltransferase substrate binding protein [bacterium]
MYSQSFTTFVRIKSEDLRWKQRFSNFNKALDRLREFKGIGENLNKFEKQELIKAFEYTYELAWNTIKDYYEYQGESNMQGSRYVIQLAFNRGLIFDGEGWMQMLKDRNKTTHTYNQETAEEIASNILNRYFKLFKDLHMELIDK